MEEYTLLRAFADSWMMLALFALFVLVVLRLFRPGASRLYRDIAEIPFRHDDRPAADPASAGMDGREGSDAAGGGTGDRGSGENWNRESRQ